MRGTVTTHIQPTRLTPEERGTVRAAAERCGVTMSDLMRAAALEYAALKLGTATTGSCDRY